MHEDGGCVEEESNIMIEETGKQRVTAGSKRARERLQSACHDVNTRVYQVIVIS